MPDPGNSRLNGRGARETHDLAAVLKDYNLVTPAKRRSLKRNPDPEYPQAAVKEVVSPMFREPVYNTCIKPITTRSSLLERTWGPVHLRYPVRGG